MWKLRIENFRIKAGKTPVFMSVFNFHQKCHFSRPCNIWAHWHKKRARSPILISSLDQKYVNKRLVIPSSKTESSMTFVSAPWLTRFRFFETRKHFFLSKSQKWPEKKDCASRKKKLKKRKKENASAMVRELSAELSQSEKLLFLVSYFEKNRLEKNWEKKGCEICS